MKLRGFGDVRTNKMYVSGFWPWDWLKISEDYLEIKTLYRRVKFRPDQIVELRFFKRLFPHVVVIAKIGENYVKASFRYFREKTLRTALVDKGFHITQEAVWETIRPLDSEDDIFKYRLYKGGD